MGRGWERAVLIAALETLALAALLLVLASGAVPGITPARSSIPAGRSTSSPATDDVLWLSLPVVLVATQTPWPTVTPGVAMATPPLPPTPRLVTPTPSPTVPPCGPAVPAGVLCRQIAAPAPRAYARATATHRPTVGRCVAVARRTWRTGTGR